MTWQLIPLLIGAYLAGSVPFGLILGKMRGIDLREHGSGNLGATNAVRVLGFKLGALCFLLDVGKGLVPVLVGGAVLGTLGQVEMAGSAGWSWLAVGFAAVLGHVFPVWVGFKGGKGVATSLGVLLGFWPVLTVPAAAGLIVWLLFVALFRYVGLASVIAGLALPVATLVAAEVRGMSDEAALPFTVMMALLALLVLIRHRGNLQRVAAGTESRVGRKK